jgi:hypothetical protein
MRYLAGGLNSGGSRLHVINVEFTFMRGSYAAGGRAVPGEDRSKNSKSRRDD